MKTACRHCVLSVVPLLLILAATPSSARKEHFEIQQAPDANPSTSTSKRGPTLLGEQILGQWDFESAGHGWTVVDRTVQTGTFTHVDNFSSVTPLYAPLSGAQSLWCGRAPGDCQYLALPGYGNDWDQHFTSIVFPGTGADVNVAFMIRYDCEPGYDVVRLEYQADGGAWTEWTQFTGVGTTYYSTMIPGATMGASFRLRFRFTSDGVYSDEDGNYNSTGAYVVDDVYVGTNGGPVINFQDFESEAVGALTTTDGAWTADPGPAYGVHAALFSGEDIVQEDPLVTNETQLWGFFNNSTENYECGGHPGQAVVPYAKPVDGETLYIENEIWSPAIDVTQDINGLPVTGPITMSADIYRGMTLEALVFYRYRVRSFVGGCWKNWRSNGIVYYHQGRTWAQHAMVISPLIDAGATQIQVAVGVVDMCETWCGIFGNGACHSHGPLVDNVKVSAGVLMVTNTGNSGAGSLRQAILDANASSDVSLINFNIPGAGPHTITPTGVLPTITQRVTIDGYSQPGASVNTNGLWEADNAVIKIVLDGSATVLDGLVIQTANQCIIRGLAITDFAGNGIFVEGAGNEVKGCFIGLDADGTTAGYVGDGILVAGTGTIIGGDTPADRNVISACNTAVWLAAGNCTVKNNFIGTDATGTLNRGNVQGIMLNSGPAFVSTNLISGNSQGVVFGSFNNNGTQVLGNRIGTTVTGTSGVGNTLYGIQAIIEGGFGGVVTIGTPTASNLIAFNGGAGIRTGGLFGGGPFPQFLIDANEIHSNAQGVVVGAAGNVGPMAKLTRNSIHDNTGLGVDLANDGVTPNDAGDFDSGPNDLQNFPTNIVVSIGATANPYITGSLSSKGSQFYAIEYFASPACDGSGLGEGKVYLGATAGISLPSGTLDLFFNAPTIVPGGWYITANATHVASGATSEFSNCYQFINSQAGAEVIVVPVEPSTLESPVQLTFENISAAGNTSLSISDNGPPPPGSLTFGEDPAYYDLSTTATFTGAIQICIHYDESILVGPESALKVMHYDDFSNTWVDITSSLDTVGNILCGTTTTLSPFVIAQPTQTTDVDEKAPSAFALHPCAPNPFNPSTTIRYDVPTNVRVSIAIFDVTGRRVATLVDGVQPAGTRSTTWDGRDERGQSVASGVYFYRMIAGQFTQTRKMVLLK